MKKNHLYLPELSLALFLAQYEGKTYDPEFINPEPSNAPMTYALTSAGNKNCNVYPNPATSEVYVNWETPGASFEIRDVSGRTVFQCLLTGGITRVPINKLQAGLYVTLIKENGKTTYQQNIIKK